MGTLTRLPPSLQRQKGSPDGDRDALSTIAFLTPEVRCLPQRPLRLPFLSRLLPRILRISHLAGS